MADYQPVEGDIYIQEVRAGRFTIHRFDGEHWSQMTTIDEQERQALISVMQFLGSGKGRRRYHRPLLQYRVKE